MIVSVVPTGFQFENSVTKGVKVDVLEDVVTVEATLNLKYGYNVKDVSVKVQFIRKLKWLSL